jgi:hypothetical protein
VSVPDHILYSHIQSLLDNDDDDDDDEMADIHNTETDETISNASMDLMETDSEQEHIDYSSENSHDRDFVDDDIILSDEDISFYRHFNNNL